MLLQIVWVNVSFRYLFPVLPFLILYFVAGIKNLKKGARLTVISGALLCYSYSSAMIVSYSLKSRISSALMPINTFKWVRENTAEDDVFLGGFPSRFYINTDRKMISWFPFTSADDFYLFVQKHVNVDYVAFFSSKDVQPAHQYSLPFYQKKRTEFIMKDSSRYEKVYSNDMEETEIWKIRKSTAYVRAWDIYMEGLSHYSKKDYDNAAEKLSEAVSVYGKFPTLRADLARVYMKMKDFSKAAVTLNEAIKVHPGDMELLMLRGYFHRNRGEYVLSSEDYKRAFVIAESLGMHDKTEELAGMLDQLKGLAKE
jgi:hypothetical protein